MTTAKIVCACVIALVLLYMCVRALQQEPFRMASLHLKHNSFMKDDRTLQVDLAWDEVQPRPFRIDIDAAGYNNLQGIIKQPIDRNSVTVFFTPETAPRSPMLRIRVFAVNNLDVVYAKDDISIPNPFYTPAPIVPAFEYDPPHRNCSSNVVLAQ